MRTFSFGIAYIVEEFVNALLGVVFGFLATLFGGLADGFENWN